MQTTIELKRYQELDAIRAIAVVMVVFFYFTLERQQSKFEFYSRKTGVALVFIISEFVVFISVLWFCFLRQIISNPSKIIDKI